MTPTIYEAKERVVRSLLNRVSVFDEKLSSPDVTDDVDELKKYYIAQTRLLLRIEKLVSN
tara:strand:- start:279 stop:458 length:180 start_codon:yes stop_codon:yes gene_type:complete